MEPGVFGVIDAVLLLPASLFEQLTPGQLSAVIAHELYHVRRRDNLVAAFHIFVETVFWFHPMRSGSAPAMRASSAWAANLACIPKWC